ncbi:hypothetical protein GUITHDRAFT_64161 [Guillardia theta CCMP2712]|uniref:3'(2'),5'-bisphosphate nucleotidase 1 n=1 Tax=Guillardia theta (strain CCMP2712) TaxID=905079 RepID=L1JYR7_GUITC|nr:hypothetical protein GUITHDRAFT_64161 [Guillardia theta CCMP2712]EKX53721.1 hypothetical protein GUITHDRAFT_64161 [Guillardia theta CCMP2712]|eukprot:XP_005840701.1 hypothetical protein GUITHDRAFT_64161 [Guillardia theta CCMP2712]
MDNVQGRLTKLVHISKRACDQLGILVRSIYSSIDEQTATVKQDKSAFTIADGLVQELLSELFEGKVKTIVGEEDDAQVRLDRRPMTVGSLCVPEQHERIIERSRRGMQELGRELEDGGYQDLTVFIDPIDGTREFSTKKGEQCSICIGFSDGGGQAVAGLVYRPIPEGGFLTTNGKISGFVEKLMGELKEERVSSGGAGNKMLMLLEGKGGMYIQDRGVSRWDTCAAQAVIEAYGGLLCRLDREVKAYSNLNGLLAVSKEGRERLGEVREAMRRVEEEEGPSYD